MGHRKSPIVFYRASLLSHHGCYLYELHVWLIISWDGEKARGFFRDQYFAKKTVENGDEKMADSRQEKMAGGGHEKTPENSTGGPVGGKTWGPFPMLFHRHPALLFWGVFSSPGQEILCVLSGGCGSIVSGEGGREKMTGSGQEKMAGGGHEKTPEK
jgi:hypothetical protein